MNESNETQVDADRRLERAIVLALLGEDAERGFPPAQLADALAADPHALERGLSRLCEMGVVHETGSHVLASDAARHIDALGLIAV